MTELAERMVKEARLRILKELAKQVDGRLSELSMRTLLDMHGIVRDRDWIATQLRKMEALGAVELITTGTVMHAKILRAGRDHVEERAVIEGVLRPSDDY